MIHLVGEIRRSATILSDLAQTHPPELDLIKAYSKLIEQSLFVTSSPSERNQILLEILKLIRT